MWVPEAWEDLEAAVGVQIEQVDLDFKRQMPDKDSLRDIAKDVAAMSIDGGVIVIGMDEEEGVASEITPIDLKQAIERLQQVIDSNVRPPLLVEIRPIRENEGDESGVLVISVPQSWSAPHQHRGRYPARSGSTTRELEEREIEALYRRRAELRAAPAQAGGVVNHTLPPGVKLELDRGVGLLTMHAGPIGRIRHPAEPHLRTPLREATARATRDMGKFVAAPLPVRALDFLTDWEPAGPYGWRAGWFVGDAQQLSGAGVAVGAMYRYGNGFSLSVTINLEPNEPGPRGEGEFEPTGDLCAYEHLWAAETLGLLRIAGQFFAPLPEASMLRVDLALGGLLDATSYQGAGGMVPRTSAPVVTENNYPAGGNFPTRQLADDPRDAVRELLDPFMVAILQESSDIVDWLATCMY